MYVYIKVILSMRRVRLLGDGRSECMVPVTRSIISFCVFTYSGYAINAPRRRLYFSILENLKECVNTAMKNMSQR